MEAKHTPGPWFIRPGYGLLKSEIGPSDRAVAAVWVKEPYRGQSDGAKEAVTWPEGEANAHLIAAVPELLEALKIVTNDLACIIEKAGRQAALDPRIKKARAAIAKAQPQEGGE